MASTPRRAPATRKGDRGQVSRALCRIRRRALSDCWVAARHAGRPSNYGGGRARGRAAGWGLESVCWSAANRPPPRTVRFGTADAIRSLADAPSLSARSHADRLITEGPGLARLPLEFHPDVAASRGGTGCTRSPPPSRSACGIYFRRPSRLFSRHHPQAGTRLRVKRR